MAKGHTVLRLFYALALITAVSGCSGSKYEGAKRYAVSGNVTFDGEPVDGGIIAFTPTTEVPANQRPSGGVISNGKYSIPEGQGVNSGTYQVEIRWSRPTGKKVRDTQDTGEMIDVTEQVIPDKYNTVTELRVEVSGTQNTFDFNLTSK